MKTHQALKLATLSFLFISHISYADQVQYNRSDTKYIGLNVGFPVIRSVRQNFFAHTPQFRPLYSAILGKSFHNTTLEAEVFYLSLPMSAQQNKMKVNFTSYGVILNATQNLLQRNAWTVGAGIGVGATYNKTSDITVSSRVRVSNTAAKGKSLIKPIFQAMIGVHYNIDSRMSVGTTLKYMHLNTFKTNLDRTGEHYDGKMNLYSVNLNFRYYF